MTRVVSGRVVARTAAVVLVMLLQAEMPSHAMTQEFAAVIGLQLHIHALSFH